MTNRILTSRAIVACEPQDGQPTFEMREDLTLRPKLQDDELIVRIIASGICHTDLVLANLTASSQSPRVLGHEGS